MKNLIATKTTLIGSSDTNPEYYKFKVELSNGEVIPAYGKSLQEALRKAQKDLTIQSFKRDIRQLYGIALALICIIAVSLVALLYVYFN